MEPPKPKRSFEVEEILGYTMVDETIWFEIKWKGFPSSDNTLEPFENIKGCKQFESLLEKQVSERSQEIEGHYNQIMSLHPEILVIAREGVKRIIKQLEIFSIKELQQNLLLSLILNGGSAKFKNVKIIFFPNLCFI